MLVPIVALEDFFNFIEGTFDVKINEAPQNVIDKSGEYARFILLDRFYVVRKPDESVKNPVLVEVWSSDRDHLERIEKTWMQWWSTKVLSDIEKDERTGDGS